MLRVAGLIIARDEAAVIADTVHRFRAVTPPGTPLFVVADRCSDATAAAARTAGAIVLERRDGPAGKGAALAWAMEQGIGDGTIEGIVLLDADTSLRPGAIEHLAGALESSPAAQAFVMPVFDPRVPVAVLSGYSEWLSQVLDDRLRHRLGWPVPLRGTGTAFRVNRLRELSRRLRTKTEDVELTVLLASAGDPIAFVAGAIVDDPKPRGTTEASRQRARWLQGQRETWRYHWREILTLLTRRGLGGWSLAGALFLKPRTLALLGKALLVTALGASTAPPVTALRLVLIISLAVDLARYAAGLLIAPRAWRSALLAALLRVPVYLVIWIRAAALSLGRAAWYRARD